MNGGYALRSEDLLAHAAEVGQIAGDMRAVAQAGQPLPEAAYGVVGQLFTGQVQATDQAVSHLVGGLSRDVSDHEQALRAVAAAYQEHETNTANGFAELHPGDAGSAADPTGPTAPAGSAATGGGSRRGGSGSRGGVGNGEPVGSGGEQGEDSVPPPGSISKALGGDFTGGSDGGGSDGGHGQSGPSGDRDGPRHASPDLGRKQADAAHRLAKLDDWEAKLDHEHDRLAHQLDRHDLSRHHREKLAHRLHHVEHEQDAVQHEQHQLRHEAAPPRHEAAEPPTPHPAPPSDTSAPPDGPAPADPDTPMVSV